MLAGTTAQLLSSSEDDDIGSARGDSGDAGGASLTTGGPRDDDRSSAPHQPGWTAIGPYPSERHLREAALVLSAMDIPHAITRTGGGFLLVRDADYDRARHHLDRYEEENRDFPPTRAVERARYRGPPLVALLFAALVVFAYFTGPVSKPNGAWFTEGAAVSQLVLSSEPYRAVTALTLHADGMHVFSNLLSGAIFGRAVERRFGPGAAALAILGAGTFGNLANAGFHAAQGVEHGSIGASTAVFGAIGLLATSQLVLGGRLSSNGGASRHWTEYLAPLVGGVALLGALGSGPATDIWAHAFGLIAGLAIGLPFALAAKRSRRPALAPQLVLGAVALAVVGASWAAALA